MERQRHTKDMAHPMYDTIDNASSAAVDGYYMIVTMYEGNKNVIFLIYWFFILSADKNSKTCEMCSNTSY